MIFVQNLLTLSQNLIILNENYNSTDSFIKYYQSQTEFIDYSN